MSDLEFVALTALVTRETALLQADVAKYGEAQWDYRTPAWKALEAELVRRGVVGVSALSAAEADADEALRFGVGADGEA